MIHTFEVKSSITYRQAVNLVNDLTEEAITTPLVIKGPFGKHGYQKLILTKAPHPINTYHLSIVIEPQSLINNRVCIELFEPTSDNVQLLKQILSHKFSELEQLYGISHANWYLARLDIAKQVRTNDVELYIQLLKRAKCPYHYQQKAFSEGSSYISSKSTCFNFYDKHDQASKRNYNQEYLTALDNILRLEIQWKERTKIKSIMKKHSITEEIWGLMNMDLLTDEYLAHYQRLIGFDNFHTIDKVLEVIDRNNKQQKTRERMHMLVRHLNAYPTIEGALKCISDNTLLAGFYKSAKGEVDYEKITRDIRTRIEGTNKIALINLEVSSSLINPIKLIFPELGEKISLN